MVALNYAYLAARASECKQSYCQKKLCLGRREIESKTLESGYVLRKFIHTDRRVTDADIVSRFFSKRHSQATDDVPTTAQNGSQHFRANCFTVTARKTQIFHSLVLYIAQMLKQSDDIRA
jgi:hypothetical protein